jgi:endogenous inhibitor of DNA gyrase (YacG/DUF329 family)
MSLIRCPTCAQQFDPQASLAVPFCSKRCRQIDLNRWLKEEISIPTDVEAGEPEDPGPRRDDRDDED